MAKRKSIQIPKIIESFKKRLFYFTPRRYKQLLAKEIKYAGLQPNFVNRFLTFSILFSVSFAIILGFDTWVFGFENIAIPIGLVGGIVVFAILQISIVLIADSRALQVENILPDALQLMAANVRAGMTVDKAIWLSARPEFGIFEEEIRRAGAKSVAGKPLKVALTEMTETIKSEILTKTVKLIIEGIEAGGELAQLLEETANNIRVKQVLKKEIKSSVTAYSIFILFATVLGAPALFSISLFFVETMTRLWAPDILGGVTIRGEFTGGGFLSHASGPTITPDQLFWFAIACLSIMGFFGSLTIGLIQTGKEKDGLKFIPLLMVGSILMFLLAHTIISNVFSGFFLI